MRKFGFPALLGLLWLIFFAAWYQFPYIRPGAVVIYAAKESSERQGTVFPANVPRSRRLIVFGNSKVLTGFIPAVFDREVQTQLPGLYSVNMGKPDESEFVSDLEILAAKGQLPRHIVLTLPWSVGPPNSILNNDEALAATLFPFRHLPRDFFLFSALAPGRGGFRAFYRYGRAAARRMAADRGWYFIEGQSHYPADRLPDGFHLPSDTPETVYEPAFLPRGEDFARLCTLAQRYGLEFFIAPGYHRTGERAPPPAQAVTVAQRLGAYPYFTVLGPSYFLFPPDLFSDPVHLNPRGALLYTRELARLLRPHLS